MSLRLKFITVDSRVELDLTTNHLRILTFFMIIIKSVILLSPRQENQPVYADNNAFIIQFIFPLKSLKETVIMIF